jgi:hypothetical protein
MTDKWIRLIEKQNDQDPSSLYFLNKIDAPQLVSLILYLVGPDPLEMLCRLVFGLPLNYKFN